MDNIDPPGSNGATDPKNELENLKKEMRRIQCELDEAHSLVAVANYSLEESLETERRKCREEVATLQQLMKENLQEAVRQTQEQNETEIRRLKNLVTRLELEVHEFRSSEKDNPNVFSAVTKTLARKVNNLANTSLSSSPTPSYFPTADTAGDDLESSMKRAQEDAEVLRSLVLPLEEEIKALKDKLRTTDDQLRLYESTQSELVRGTQLMNQLTDDQSVETILSNLVSKTTDDSNSENILNNNFGLFLALFTAQRTTLFDEKERLRNQLQETCQALDHERRQHRELRRTWQRANDQLIESQAHAEAVKEATPEKQTLQDKISAKFSRISPVLKRKPLAPKESETVEVTPETAENDNVQGEGPLLRLEQCPDVEQVCHRCQQATVENEQLQNDKTHLEKQLSKSREEAERMSNLVKDMEHKWTQVAKDYEKQVTSLHGDIEESQKQLKSVYSAYKRFRNQAQETLRQLYFDRQSVSTELFRLQEENDYLVGKHSQHAEQLQNETINLPDNLQELQYVVLNLREDLIAAKVAKEAFEKKCQTEMLFVKDQLASEQQAKESLENSLSAEIDYLREQLGLMRSVHTQLDEESNRKASLEVALQKAKQQLAEQQQHVSESVSIKDKMETELSHLRSRVSSLQADLETSEAVQRDFVQLSQQLQVQLEKIRQSEKELRWQYEEDVDNCGECRQPFNVTKRKHHCRHCSQIYCGECLKKTVTSGPNKRQSRVCNVCYYLLVQDSAPFFSSEPKKPVQ